ncbi:MAG: ABC transporter ATP-binding protein [Alphaproteobacteria bacterium]|nr:ABC transporter ATP-binding protein [Alphaproteobacteria bacterium]
MSDITNKQVFSFIFKMMKPFPVAIGVMILVAIFFAIDLSLRPYVLKIILNRIAELPPHNVFVYLTGPVIVYLTLMFTVTSVYRLYSYFVDIKMIPQLRQYIASSIFKILLNHSHHYYQNNFSGSLANKVSDLISCIPDIIRICIDRFLSNGLALIIAFYTLWQVNIKLAFVLLVWISFFMLVSLLRLKRLVYFSREWSEGGSVITGKIVDTLSNILSVWLFARQDKEQESLELTLKEVKNAEIKLQWTYFWIWFSYGYSHVICQGLSFYILMQGFQQGELSVGDFGLVLTINFAISDFLWELTKDFSDFSKYLGRISQALQIIMVPYEIQDQSGANTLVVTKGTITFEEVEFHYKNAKPLFVNLSVHLEAGQKVGLVGYSGSGKTTFVNLILRLFEIKSGRILIDNNNIQKVTQESLRQAIGMIPQDPGLFHRTVMENVRYAKTEADDQAVIEAVKRAHAEDFITALPESYQSIVGEKGIKLSGGQRQRLAIARTILKNAPILILDEATSQLDSVTESYIQDSLWTLMQDKTTLVIAHRLSTLLRMDRILVFDQGKIVEDGTHKELLEKGGLYKTLWEAQVGGFLPETR